MRIRLTRRDLEFSEEEALLLDDALRNFLEARRGKGVVGLSHYLSGYTPVLAIALLKAQKRLEYLTWALIILTVVLAFLTGKAFLG